jgi:hypothetical protein
MQNLSKIVHLKKKKQKAFKRGELKILNAYALTH